MASNIVEHLKLMCDATNPQDKKLLLLAQLVEERCEDLGNRQGELMKCFELTDKKLDHLTSLLQRYDNDKKSCPVYKNKDNFERMSLLLKYPRATILILIGLMAVVSGYFSSNADKIMSLLGL